jgi:hypothetical protein
MTGVLTELGEVSVGACVPLALAAFGAVEGDLNGQLAAAGNLKIALDVGLPTVAVAAQIGATATAQAMFSVTSPYFGTAGVYLYQYSGTADSFGTALQSVVGSGLPGGQLSDHVDSIVLIASTPAAWAALQQIFKTS